MIPQDIRNGNSNYNPDIPTSVIVHGWKSNGIAKLIQNLKSILIDVQDVNVFVVDWSHIANYTYNDAAASVPHVGQQLGNFLIWLINNAGGNWKNLHLIGFGLGANVVGNAGRTASGSPGRITGLDPAGPGGNSNALNTAAGQYVEAIHTDGGRLGIFDRIAHADFYPNGGRHPQPGCLLNNFCSHVRALELFASSVRTNHFVGHACINLKQALSVKCSGAAFNMGNNIINKTGNGIFGLTTSNSWPY